MSSRLIVNADDFGYFDEVSRGIIEVMQAGVVTATGVMANGPALERWVGALMEIPGVSVGVHLNVTLGRPLTERMRRELAVLDNCDPAVAMFPPKWRMVGALLTSRIASAAVLEEWRAQIERCRQFGLRVDFVNSHEHLHILPSLHAKVRALAGEFGIRHVRAAGAELGPAPTAAGLVRAAALGLAKVLTPARVGAEPRLLGVAPSGRLDGQYLRWRLARLRNGLSYELMCHPGRADPMAAQEPRLAAYHDWEGELATLTDPAFRQALRAHSVQLVSYADVDAVNSGVGASP